jgi:hypothetical protein
LHHCPAIDSGVSLLFPQDDRIVPAKHKQYREVMTFFICVFFILVIKNKNCPKTIY